MRHVSSRKIDMKAVSRRLRDLVRYQYPSIKDFADAIGVSRNTMYRMLNSGEFPSIPTMVDVCAQLGCSVDSLLGLLTPESDAREAYVEAVLNIQAYGSQWKQEDRLALAAAAAGLLNEALENRLINRMLSK